MKCDKQSSVRRLKFVLLLVVLSLMSAPLCANPLTALSADTVQLTDGRTLRLSLIMPPADPAWAKAAETRLSELVAQNPTLIETGTDRYGRVLGDFRLAGQQLTIQAILLREGLATLYPVSTAHDTLADWQRWEHEARKTRRGLWSDPTPIISADAASTAIGGYAFIQGKVVNATRVKNKVYVNFGSDWRTDFTLETAAGDLRRLKKSGLDPLSLTGQTILARGWVEQRNGPMMVVTEAWQVTTSE